MGVHRLEHDALFYRTDEEYVDALVPFLRAGLARGEAAAAATSRAHIDVLRDALGGDAGAVHFLPDDEHYIRPTWTIATWVRMLRQARDGGVESVRLIGEVSFGTLDTASWTRYESAANRIFAGERAWIICPYNVHTLPGTVIEDAWRTHPTVWRGARYESARYTPPEILLTRIREPLPPVIGPPDLDLPIASVTEVRAAVAQAANHAAIFAHRRDDLMLALGEVAANSVRHGRGERRLRLWVGDGRIVCDVRDEGLGPVDPLAGYVPPDPGALAGMGLWLARSVADALAIESDTGGTTVRFAIGTGR